ncbi:MAG: sensor histidine kinase [Deltaproteobacteria bacterium]|nr:sensor histidine kinase [Deltaproteobacteria bacterium]
MNLIGKKQGKRTKLGRRGLWGVAVLLAWSVWGGAALAESPDLPPLILTHTEERISLPPVFHMLEDPERSLTVEQAASPQRAAQYKPIPGGKISVGFTDSAYWYRLRVTNHTQESRWILDVGFLDMDQIDLHVLSADGRWTSLHSGAPVPARQRPFNGRHLDFPLELPPGQTVTLYLRLANAQGIVTTPVSLGTHQRMEHDKRGDDMIVGMYYGVVYGLALYNLFLFFLLRNRSYLAYVGFNLLVSLMQLQVDGIFQAYIFPGLPKNQDLFVILFACSGLLILLMSFARKFLELPRTLPGWDRVILGQQLAIGVTLAAGVLWLALNLPHFQWLIQVTFVQAAAIVELAVLGLWLAWRNEALARYFVAAQMSFLAGGMVLILLAFGWVPNNFATMHSMQAGSAAEMILFSMALAEQVNRIRSARDRAEALAQFQAAENQELRQAKTAMEDAIRLKDRFVTLMAHDIRTPISAILLLAETLKLDDNPLSPNQMETLNRVRVRGEGFLKMAEELMRFNQLQSGKVTVEKTWVTGEDISADPMGLGILAEGKGIRLVNQVPPTARFYCDPMLTREVLQNIMVNAIKFCRAGDTVTLALAGDHSLKVADNGPGIAPGLLQDLFREDKKTSTVGSAGEIGTGLGLPLARVMTRIQGGDLRVESAEGKGAVFYVDLPPEQDA